jgi:methylmalonyl-CoA/ethylmalonyl-CoA epimerase
MTDGSETHRPDFGPCIQIGVVVRDLDRATQALSDLFGIGPWRTIVYPPEDRTDVPTTYRGQAGQFRYRLAFADLGSVELEMVQPLEGESIWSDFLRQHGEGVHHIRFNVEDLDAALSYLAAQGIGVLQSGSGLRPGTFWANLDTETRVGFTVELMKPVPGTDGRTPAISGGRVQP